MDQVRSIVCVVHGIALGLAIAVRINKCVKDGSLVSFGTGDVPLEEAHPSQALVCLVEQPSKI